MEAEEEEKVLKFSGLQSPKIFANFLYLAFLTVLLGCFSKNKVSQTNFPSSELSTMTNILLDYVYFILKWLIRLFKFIISFKVTPKLIFLSSLLLFYFLTFVDIDAHIHVFVGTIPKGRCLGLGFL